jgi:hypothetical protein
MRARVAAAAISAFERGFSGLSLSLGVRSWLSMAAERGSEIGSDVGAGACFAAVGVARAWSGIWKSELWTAMCLLRQRQSKFDSKSVVDFVPLAVGLDVLGRRL